LPHRGRFARLFAGLAERGASLQKHGDWSNALGNPGGGSVRLVQQGWNDLLSFRDTLKKSSFPRRRESRVLILLGFAFGENSFFE